MRTSSRTSCPIGHATGCDDEPADPYPIDDRVRTVNDVQNDGRRPRTLAARDTGFTLVEILVVIVVLGVLASIVAFSVRGTSEQTGVTGCAVERRAVISAIEVYQAEHGELPDDLDSLVPEFLSKLPGPGTATGGGSYDPADGRFDPSLC